MTQPVTFSCGSCDVCHNGTLPNLPEGWRWNFGQPYCADCAQHIAHDSQSALSFDIDQAMRSETSIRLLSGAYLDLANPDCSVIAPIDIAAGLRQPRFSAQTRQFYTIAQHSLLVLRLVSSAARALGGEKGLQLRRCALMHDAAEAFLHDITRPLKIQLVDYRAIEARMETRLAATIGFEFTQWRREQVKLADLQALAIEQRDLVGNTDAWPILDRIDRAELACIKIGRCWHPDEAMDRFLAAFEDLFPTE